MKKLFLVLLLQQFSYIYAQDLQISISSTSSYSVCQESGSVFPTDPSGGTVVTLGDDDYAEVDLSGTNSVAIYGTRTNVFFIGSNGYLTMNDWVRR